MTDIPSAGAVAPVRQRRALLIASLPKHVRARIDANSQQISDKGGLLAGHGLAISPPTFPALKESALLMVSFDPSAKRRTGAARVRLALGVIRGTVEPNEVGQCFPGISKRPGRGEKIQPGYLSVWACISPRKAQEIVSKLSDGVDHGEKKNGKNKKTKGKRIPGLNLIEVKPSKRGRGHSSDYEVDGDLISDILEIARSIQFELSAEVSVLAFVLSKIVKKHGFAEFARADLAVIGLTLDEASAALGRLRDKGILAKVGRGRVTLWEIVEAAGLEVQSGSLWAAETRSENATDGNEKLAEGQPESLADGQPEPGGWSADDLADGQPEAGVWSALNIGKGKYQEDRNIGKTPPPRYRSESENIRKVLDHQDPTMRSGTPSASWGELTANERYVALSARRTALLKAKEALALDGFRLVADALSGRMPERWRTNTGTGLPFLSRYFALCDERGLSYATVANAVQRISGSFDLWSDLREPLDEELPGANEARARECERNRVEFEELQWLCLEAEAEYSGN